MDQVHHSYRNGRAQHENEALFNPNEDAYRRPASIVHDDKTFIRDNVYQMVAEPRGQVLIINNANHSEAHQTLSSGGTARGGENGGSYREDGERLMSTFKSLGFAVYKRDQFYDLSRRRMEKLLRKFANSKLHKYADACVVVFLTHGNFRDGVYAADGWKIAFEDIVKFFGESEVLYRKPKIFIFDGMHGGGYPDRGVSPPAVTSRDELLDEEPQEYGARRRVDTGIHNPAALNNNNDSIQSWPSTGVRNASNRPDGDVHYITHNRSGVYGGSSAAGQGDGAMQQPLAAGADMVFIYNCMHRSQPSSYMNEFQQSCFTSSLHKLLYFNRGYFENTPLLSDDSDISIGTASHSLSPRLGPRRDHNFNAVASSTTSSLSSAQQPQIPSRPKKQQKSLDRELYLTKDSSRPLQPDNQVEEQSEVFVETQEGYNRLAPVAITTTTTVTREVVVEEVIQQKPPGTPTGGVEQATTSAARPSSGLKNKFVSRTSRSVASVSSSSGSTSSVSSVESGGDEGVGGTAANKIRGRKQHYEVNRDVASRTKSLDVSLGDEKARYTPTPDTVDYVHQEKLRQTLPATPTVTKVYNEQTFATTSKADAVRPRGQSFDTGRTKSPPPSAQQKKKKRSFMSKLRRLFKNKKDKPSTIETSSSATAAATLPSSSTTPVVATSYQQQTSATRVEPVAQQSDDEYPHWIHSSPQPARRSNRSYEGKNQHSPVPPQQQQLSSVTSTGSTTPVMTTPSPFVTKQQIFVETDQREDQPYRRVVVDEQNSDIVTTFPSSVRQQINQNEDDNVLPTRKPHNSGLYEEDAQPQQVQMESYKVTTVTTKLPDDEPQNLTIKPDKFVVTTKGSEIVDNSRQPLTVSSRQAEVVERDDDTLQTNRFSPYVEVYEQRGRIGSGNSGRRTPLDKQVTKRTETFPLTSPLPAKSLSGDEFFGACTETPSSPLAGRATSPAYERTMVIEKTESLTTSPAPGQSGLTQYSTSSSTSVDLSPKSSRGEKPPVPEKPGILSFFKKSGNSSNNPADRSPTPPTPTTTPVWEETERGFGPADETTADLYQRVIEEPAKSPTRPRSPPPPPPPTHPLWTFHDPAHRSPDTADVHTLETTTTTTQVSAPAFQPATTAVLVQSEPDALYEQPVRDDDVDSRTNNILTERSMSSSSSRSKDEVKKSPISWLTGKKHDNADDLQIRTITVAQVPVLQSKPEITTEENYTSESVEGRATPTGQLAYGTAQRRKSSSSSSNSDWEEAEKTPKKPNKLKQWLEGGSSSPAKFDAEHMARDSSSPNDSRPYIKPVLEPVIDREIFITTTQLNPVEKQRQQEEDYNRVIEVPQRQISAPASRGEDRPHIEPVLVTSQRPLANDNVEQTGTVISPTDEHLYRVKDVETSDEVRSSGSGTPVVRQFSRGVSQANDEQRPQSPRTPGSTMSKLKEKFFGSSTNAEETPTVVDRQQSSGTPTSPHKVITTTTTHSASTTVVPLNSPATPTANYFDLNQQPIGWKAEVLPNYPPDYSHSTSASNRQQQNILVDDDEISNRRANEERERNEATTVEVLRETITKQTIPDERPPRVPSRTSEYITPRSSTHEDEENTVESYHTPQNYIASNRNIDSDDDDRQQHTRYTVEQTYGPRTPTNSVSTTRFYDTHDGDDSQTRAVNVCDNERDQHQPIHMGDVRSTRVESDFENETERAAYAAQLRHVEREEKIAEEQEVFTGRVPELVRKFESIASISAEPQYYRSQTSSASPTFQQQQQHQQQQQRYEETESDTSLSPAEQRRRLLLVERSESAIAQQEKRRSRHDPYPSHVVEEESEEHYRTARGGGSRVSDDDDEEVRRRDGRRPL